MDNKYKFAFLKKKKKRDGQKKIRLKVYEWQTLLISVRSNNNNSVNILSYFIFLPIFSCNFTLSSALLRVCLIPSYVITQNTQFKSHQNFVSFVMKNEKITFECHGIKTSKYNQIEETEKVQRKKISRKTARSYAFQFILIWFKCITTTKQITKNASILFAKYLIFQRVVKIKLLLATKWKLWKWKLIEKMNQFKDFF